MNKQTYLLSNNRFSTHFAWKHFNIGVFVTDENLDGPFLRKVDPSGINPGYVNIGSVYLCRVYLVYIGGVHIGHSSLYFYYLFLTSVYVVIKNADLYRYSLYFLSSGGRFSYYPWLQATTATTCRTARRTKLGRW